MTALLTISIVWLSINKGQKFEGENRDRAANRDSWAENIDRAANRDSWAANRDSWAANRDSWAANHTQEMKGGSSVYIQYCICALCNSTILS